MAAALVGERITSRSLSGLGEIWKFRCFTGGVTIDSDEAGETVTILRRDCVLVMDCSPENQGKLGYIKLEPDH
jgi:hypothetical protein